jgi:Secretion system C-terminal sorting domain/Metallo-peptidase family M12B Reprolysin-like
MILQILINFVVSAETKLNMENNLSLVKTIILMLFIVTNLKSQECRQVMDNKVADSLVLEKVISQGIISPDEARRRMKAHQSRNVQLSEPIKVLFVTQRFKQTSLNLATAQSILKSCAIGSIGCERVFLRLNETAIPFVWSNDSIKSVQSWIDLGVAAYNQNWYKDADIVIGITNDAFTDFDGYANVDSDCQPTYRGRIVIKAGASNAALAHELGHTLGLIHDDIANSLMLPSVPFSPTTMSQVNKNCYSDNVNGTSCGLSSTNDLIENSVICSPNPVFDVLKIEFKDILGNYELSLYDMLGRNIFSEKHKNGNLSIDFSKYQVGLYTLKIKSKNAELTRKIIKY